MINVQPIKDDWVNQRCYPANIPFAGFINKPDNKTVREFTKENFTYCVQSILTSIAGYALVPITYITTELKQIFDKLLEEVQSIREVFNSIREKVKAIGEELMGRLMNIMIPIQQIIMSFKDMVSKSEGVMTAGLYTLLGAYYTLQALMGAIAELIIEILIALAAVTIVLWIIPFTWGVAATNTAIFIAIAVPLAIILTFMLEVLHVQPDLSIPGVPSCFDKDTEFTMNDGTTKTIENIQVGDVLQNNDVVTAKIKVDSKLSKIYNLNNIIVSNSHIVNYKDKWINVSEHPEAKLIQEYNEPYLYCINTYSKIIELNNTIFTDWDEISKDTKDIHKLVDGGFMDTTLVQLNDGLEKYISNIQVGDILENGEIVYGIVEINTSDLNETYIYDLGQNIKAGPNVFMNIEDEIFSTLNLSNKHKTVKINKNEKLYHLLTDQKCFYINDTKFYDYNSCVDFFLNPIK
jgi:hypothetical protein